MDRIPIDQVLHDALTMAERKARRGGTSVAVEVAEGLPPIQGDYTQLCQLVTNLLINAFEALGGDGAVTLRATAGIQDAEQAGLSEERDPVPTLVVEVVDNGPGVPAEIIERVFNPFFSTKPQGSGLGLAIVRKIVDAHNGHIDVRTAPGRGTAFVVTLPTVNGEAWLQQD